MSTSQACTRIRRADVEPGDLLDGVRVCLSAALQFDEINLHSLFAGGHIIETAAGFDDYTSCLLQARRALSA